jgi:carboxylesterase type B
MNIFQKKFPKKDTTVRPAKYTVKVTNLASMQKMYIPDNKMGVLFDEEGINGLFPPSVEKMERSRLPFTTLSGTSWSESAVVKRSSPQPTHDTIRKMCSGCTTKKALEDACVHFYDEMVRNSNTSDDLQPLKQIQNDCLTFVIHYCDARLAVNAGSKVYLYSFEFSDFFNHDNGPNHADELIYLFGTHNVTLTTKGTKIRKYLGRFFSYFIKYGRPDVSAKKLNLEEMNYFRIAESRANRLHYHRNASEFWLSTNMLLGRFCERLHPLNHL